MKYTLIQLVQSVLSSIDGDEVNSINDTVESQSVLNIIKRCYGNIAEAANYPKQYTLFGLTASGDSNLKTVMYLPTAVAKNLEWVRYDCRKLGDTDADYKIVKYVPLTEFLNRMHAMMPSQDSALVTFSILSSGQSVPFVVSNNKGPDFYTSTDDSTLVFDSYDANIDTTLQTSKTICYGEAVLPWTESDTYVIPIEDHQLLLNEAIAWAWAELKQTSNVKAEREVRHQLVRLQRKKQSVNPNSNYQTDTPYYGRK